MSRLFTSSVSESFMGCSFGGALYVVLATLRLLRFLADDDFLLFERDDFFDFEEDFLVDVPFFDLDEELDFFDFDDDFFLEDCEVEALVFFAAALASAASNAAMATTAQSSRYISLFNFIVTPESNVIRKMQCHRYLAHTCNTTVPDIGGTLPLMSGHSYV